MWNKINEILNRKNNKTEDMYINVNNSIISNPKLIANEFNTYFANVAKNLQDNIGESNNEYQDYLRNPKEHSFYLKETTPDE